MNARSEMTAAAGTAGTVELLDQEMREGVLRMRLRHSGEGPPPVTLTHRTDPVPSAMEEEAQSGIWLLTARLPASVLSEGVQTLLATLPDGTAIGAAQMIVGRPAEPAMEARLDLMRQEIDLLKTVVRRQARGD